MDVLDGVGVVGVGWICVGNSDGLVVFDGVVEGELSGVSSMATAYLTVLAEPSVVTVKADAAAVVEESGSL